MDPGGRAPRTEMESAPLSKSEVALSSTSSSPSVPSTQAAWLGGRVVGSGLGLGLM